MSFKFINDINAKSKIDTGILPKKQINGLRKITKEPTKFVAFPNDIMTDNFANKRMYITIYKSKSVTDIAAQIKNTANKAISGVSKAIKNSKGVVDGAKAAIIAAADILGEIEDFKGEEELTIALPLPNELSDAQSHGFSTDTGVIKDLAETADSMAEGVVGFSINKAVGRISASLSTQRVLANPGYFQNYTGSEPRSFSFSFKMIPNSKVEADKIVEVVKLLKKHSSPSLTANSIMIAPKFFHFWFSNTTLQNLTGIRPCIISDVQTNYAGSGILETTMDGMPKQIDISISIKELRTITEDKWAV